MSDVASIVMGAENDEPGGVDEHHAGGDPEHPAPAGRQHFKVVDSITLRLKQLQANLPLGEW